MIYILKHAYHTYKGGVCPSGGFCPRGGGRMSVILLLLLSRAYINIAQRTHNAAKALLNIVFSAVGINIFPTL